MIELSTLTGSMRAAIGTEHAGLFTNRKVFVTRMA